MHPFWKTYLSAWLLGTALVYVAAPRFSPSGSPPPSHPASPPTPRTATSTQPLAAPSQVPSNAANRNGPDSPARWGIVTQQTRAFNREGRFQRKLPAGTLASIRSDYAASIGRVAACDALLVDGRRVTDVMIPLDALVSFPGDWQETAEADRETLQRYYAVVGQLAEFTNPERRRNETTGVDAESAYRDAVAALRAHTETVPALIQQHDAATGDERIALAEQLRTKQIESARLEAKVRETRRKHRDALTSRTTRNDLEADPEYQRLCALRDRLAPTAQALLRSLRDAE